MRRQAALLAHKNISIDLGNVLKEVFFHSDMWGCLRLCYTLYVV